CRTMRRPAMGARRIPVWMVGLSGISAVSAAALWTVGLLGTRRPEMLAALLGLAALGGIAVMIAGGITFRRSPIYSLSSGLMGLASVAACALFVHAVLSNEDGPIAVTNNVSHAPRPERLRIVVFNVLHGYPDFLGQEERFHNTIAAFRALQPDVLILQEVWNT